MPYSVAQKKLAGIALAMKRHETPFSSSKDAYDMMRSMSEAELRDMASGPIKKKKK